MILAGSRFSVSLCFGDSVMLICACLILLPFALPKKASTSTLIKHLRLESSPVKVSQTFPVTPPSHPSPPDPQSQSSTAHLPISNTSITGGASHGGGSCQFSLSYDQGKTFKVVHSVIGGCPLKTNYDIKLPTGAPAGEALFAWTWISRLAGQPYPRPTTTLIIANTT